MKNGRKEENWMFVYFVYLYCSYHIVGPRQFGDLFLIRNFIHVQPTSTSTTPHSVSRLFFFFFFFLGNCLNVVYKNQKERGNSKEGKEGEGASNRICLSALKTSENLGIKETIHPSFIVAFVSFSAIFLIIHAPLYHQLTTHVHQSCSKSQLPTCPPSSFISSFFSLLPGLLPMSFAVLNADEARGTIGHPAHRHRIPRRRSRDSHERERHDFTRRRRHSRSAYYNVVMSDSIGIWSSYISSSFTLLSFIFHFFFFFFFFFQQCT